MPARRHALVTGTLYALAAGLMWGSVFVVPVLLAEYSAALLVVGRYLAFGLIALPLAWLTVRTDLPGPRLWSVLTALPLVFPSYIGGYAFVAMMGPSGS